MMLNAKLRERRKQLGLSMKEVANIVGVAEATISRWETGDISNMKRDKIALYAKALNLSPSEIMGLDDQPDHTTATPTKDDIKFALFNGSEGITDEMYDEVKAFAELVKLREEQKKGKK